jgi:lipoprotein-anchoring transpeptidase ErfK/SrfK
VAVILAVAAVVLVAAGLTATAVLAGPASPPRPTGHPVAARASSPAARETAAPPPPGPVPSLIATLSAATSYRRAPGGPVVGSLPAQNPFSAPEVLGVVARQGDGPSGWLEVQLPIRPNGSVGWIPMTGVTLTETYYRVAVNLAARTLTVSDAGKEVLTTPVAVGQPTTPTPPDNTYLWELIRPDDPNGAYGPYIFGLGEYSDAYSVFNGGDAQIGIHGQDEPWSIGQAASHGCVRLPNAVVTELAGMLPLGTPVSIS